MRRRPQGLRRSVDRGTRRSAIELRNQTLRGADAVKRGRVVPEKLPKKGGTLPPAGGVEERRLTEGNTPKAAASRTPSRTSASMARQRVQEVARRDRCVQFTALLHLISPELLRESFYELKRMAVPGIDGVTRKQYEFDLDECLKDLHQWIHRGVYRAQPSKRVFIPKSDGKLRPLGIAALEDKVVQQAVVTVLNLVYEVDFSGFSYGFRPQRGADDALWVGLMRKKVNWLLKFVQHRIADPRILRLIRNWLRAGVFEGGKWSKTDVGTPHGAVVSLLLANVYLHPPTKRDGSNLGASPPKTVGNAGNASLKPLLSLDSPTPVGEHARAPVSSLSGNLTQLARRAPASQSAASAAAETFRSARRTLAPETKDSVPVSK